MYARNLGLCFVVHCCLAATVHAPLSRSAPRGVSPPQHARVFCAGVCVWLCECRIPLGLMYPCLVHSCGMREANYREGVCMGERVSMLVSTFPCFFSCCISLGFEALNVGAHGRPSVLNLPTFVQMCACSQMSVYMILDLIPPGLGIQNLFQPRWSPSIFTHLFGCHKKSHSNSRSSLSFYTRVPLSFFVGIPPSYKSSLVICVFSIAESRTPAVHS